VVEVEKAGEERVLHSGLGIRADREGRIKELANTVDRVKQGGPEIVHGRVRAPISSKGKRINSEFCPGRSLGTTDPSLVLPGIPAPSPSSYSGLP
jgi:hypothetical protein